MKTPLLIATILTTGFASSVVLADDAAEGAVPTINEAELGIGYVSDDSWKFGRYNGLYKEGPYVVGDIKAQSFAEDGEFGTVRGTNLGLESRYLRLEGGKQGSHEFFFEFDQLPNYLNNTGATPFISPGSSILTLPAGYTPATVNNYLSPTELQTARERVGIGGNFHLKNHWKVNLSYSHETKDGIQKMGGAMADDDPAGSGGGVIRATTGALLPGPVDYETDMVDVAARYGNKKAQLAVAYHASLFKNANDSLTWQNPFPAGNAAFGSLALPPDNELHQLSLSGGYLLPYKSNLTGMLSVSRSTQNEGFQPYSTIGGGGALPRNSLDGEVWQTNAHLKLASRATRKLRLSAEYRYDGRDNQTPVTTWDGVVADDDSLTYSEENNPESYHHNQFDLIANYRITSGMSIIGGWKFDNMVREFEATKEESDSTENALIAKLKFRADSNWRLSLYGEASERKLNNYDSPPDENPAMVPFYLAARRQSKAGATLDYMPTERWNIGAKAEYNKDHYNETELGLVEVIAPYATLDVSYTVARNVTTYAYYTYQKARSLQYGKETIPSTAPYPDWQATIQDEANTFGIGTKMERIGGGKWDFGVDLVYNQSLGTIDLTRQSTVVPVPTDYPDLKTSLASLKLWTQYHGGKNLVYRLAYWYEDYSADNWAVDGLSADSLIGLPSGGPTPINTNYLLSGEQTLDYKVNVISASIIYQFM